MIKIKKKAIYKKNENKMNIVSDTIKARKIFSESKSKNLDFLLQKRFEWMNSFIEEDHIGIEVGSGAGFSKNYILNKNFKTSDFSSDDHIDIKNIDAHSTGLKNESYDYVISTNMIHHLAYPMKFFKEMHRILKKKGKLIIFEPYCSVIFQLITIFMKHEGFNFEVDVWNEKKPILDKKDLWDGNLAISNLLFDDKKKFNENLGKYFKIEFEDYMECLIFLNSGGVTSKTFYVPMNNFFLKTLSLIDKILIKISKDLFCMGRKVVLIKE